MNRLQQSKASRSMAIQNFSKSAHKGMQLTKLRVQYLYNKGVLLTQYGWVHLCSWFNTMLFVHWSFAVTCLVRQAAYIKQIRGCCSLQHHTIYKHITSSTLISNTSDWTTHWVQAFVVPKRYQYLIRKGLIVNNASTSFTHDILQWRSGFCVRAGDRLRPVW